MAVSRELTNLGFTQVTTPGETFQRFAHGNPDAAAIRYGTVTQVNLRSTTSRIPGTVDVLCTDGTREINVQILSAPVDPKTGRGDWSAPYNGSQCILITADGGVCYAAGFVPGYQDGVGNDEGKDTYSVPSSGGTRGDWVRRSAKPGAEIRLGRSGLISLTGSPACYVIINPTGELTIGSTLQKQSADGFFSKRGRLPGKNVSPNRECTHVDLYQDAVTPSTSTAVRYEHGALGSGIVRRVKVITNGTVLRGQETFDGSGNFVGEMKSYRWGSSSASENAVLGQALKTFLTEFLDLFTKHTHQSAVGPTTPPVEAPEGAQMRATHIETEKFLSDFMFAQKTGPLLV